MKLLGDGEFCLVNSDTTIDHHININYDLEFKIKMRIFALLIICRSLFVAAQSCYKKNGPYMATTPLPNIDDLYEI